MIELDTRDYERPYIKISYSEALRRIARGDPPRWRVVVEFMQRSSGHSWYIQGICPRLQNGWVMAAVHADEVIDDYPVVGCERVPLLTMARDADIVPFGILHDGIRGFRVPAARMNRRALNIVLDRTDAYSESIGLLDGGIRRFIEEAEDKHRGDKRIWFTMGGRA